MAIQFSNLASTTLASGVSSSATSVSVTSASLFPSLGGSDYFYATLGDDAGSEIVKVTAISGTTFTVVRGQDGTSAISHSAGTHFALRVTAAALEDLRDSPNVESVSKSGDTMTGGLLGTTASFSGSVTAASVVVSGTVDGRDVATDGTKLDGIEASADATDTASVTSSGALMDSELTAIASVKALNQGVATGDSPTFSNLTLSGTASVKVPSGTTAQRDGTPANGMFRYNSTNEQFEGYQSSAWGAIGGGGGSNTFTTDTFTGNGTVTAYALSQVINSENNLMVFIGGVFQQQSAYSIATASGVTTLTFSEAPANTREIVIYSIAGAVSGSNLNNDQFTANGSTTAFTLSIAPVHEANTMVFIDGVYQQKTDYAVSGTTLTFDAAPANSSVVEVSTFTQTDINVPVDNSVTTAILVDGSVTSAKIASDVALAGNPTAATQATGNTTTRLATTAFVQQEVTALVDSSPSTLDTLNELAAALGDDPNFATTTATSIGLKAPLASPTFTGTVTTAAISGTTGQFATSLNVDGTATVDGLTVGGISAYPTTNLSRDGGSAATQGYLTTGFSAIGYSGGTGADTYMVSEHGFGFAVNAGTNALVITDTGNVGIGVIPEAWNAIYEGVLQVGNGASLASSGITASEFNTNYYYDGADKYIGTGVALGYHQSAGNHIFKSATSGTAGAALSWNTAMTIDNSGRVLVGKTAVDNTTVGFRFDGSSGFSSFVRDGGEPLYLNRKTSDGDILKFAKDGATVGSWMSRSGAVSTIILNPTGAGTGLTASGTQLLPTTGAGALNNGANDLGANGYAFKDLYLSGGVVFGPASASTVSSQTLDSYEEGTWSPTLTAVGGTTSASFTAIRNHYTKVGRLVTLTTYVYNINYSGITDGSYIVLGNFPFASDDNYGGTALAYANGNVDSLYLNSGQAYAYLCNDTNGNEFNQNSAAPTTNKFMATITYFAT